MTVPVPERDPLLSRQGTSSSNPSPSGRESSELRLCADTAAPHAAMLPLFCSLIFEPQVFETRAVVDAVDHQGQPFHPRLPAGGLTGIEDDRTNIVLGQSPFNLPHQLPAFVPVRLP